MDIDRMVLGAGSKPAIPNSKRSDPHHGHLSRPCDVSASQLLQVPHTRLSLFVCVPVTFNDRNTQLRQQDQQDHSTRASQDVSSEVLENLKCPMVFTTFIHCWTLFIHQKQIQSPTSNKTSSVLHFRLVLASVLFLSYFQTKNYLWILIFSYKCNMLRPLTQFYVATLMILCEQLIVA